MTEHRGRSAVLAATTLTSFTATAMLSAVNIALPDIQRDLQVDAVRLSWIATAYLLASAVMLVPAGKLADIYGRRRVYLHGIGLYTVATAVTAAAPSVQWIIVLRIVQGLAAAMLMSTAMAIVSSVYPPRERGKAIGLIVAAVYIGLSAGPFAGGLLTGAWGWRSIFLINGPLGLVCLFLAMSAIRDEWADARGERLDVLGCVIYAAALVTGIYGLSRLPEAHGFVLALAGAAGLALFVWHELRVPAPVFEVRLFARNRAFAFSSLAALINYAATFAVAFLMSLYFQYIKGLTPQAAGTLLVCQPVVQAVFSPLAGRLSDRIEPAVIATLGMALTASGLGLLAFVDAGSGYAYIIASLVVLGLGFALFSSPNMNAIMGSVERRYYGVASGAVATMRLLGQMLSMATATLLFALIIGRVPITPAVYPQFIIALQRAFALFTGVCLAGIYFSLARGSLHASPLAKPPGGDPPRA